jgi:hypothetical protein
MSALVKWEPVPGPVTRERLEEILGHILRGPDAPRATRLILAAADAYAAPVGHTPSPSLATSREARDAACQPPRVITLRAVPDPDEPGSQVFEQPPPAALPAPVVAEPVAEPERCKTCRYLTAYCCCPGGPRDSTPPTAVASTARCRRCGYLRTRCCCPNGPRG